ncbi:hypothetical protein IAT38_007469 [Cryptococcus sp. DSM 104549]
MLGKRSRAGIFVSQRTAGAVLHPSSAPLLRSLSSTSLLPRYRPSPTATLSPIAHRAANWPLSSRIGQPRYLSSLPIIPVASSPLEDAPLSASFSPDDLSALDPVIDIPHDPLQSTASFLDPLIHPVSDALLALPHPWGYGATIILVTIVLRTMSTLPIAFWQRKRMLRVAKHVIPDIKLENSRVAEELAAKCRARGASYEQYQMELRIHMRKVAKELYNKHNANPTITTWAPLVVHMPIFVTLSLAIRRAIDLPNSPIASEHFWWLEHLGQEDGTWILPLLGMVVAFSNAELVGATRKENKAALGEPGEEVGKEEGNTRAVAAQSRASSPPRMSPTSSSARAPSASSPSPRATPASPPPSRAPRASSPPSRAPPTSPPPSRASASSPPPRPPRKETRSPRRGNTEAVTVDIFASRADHRQNARPSRPRSLSTSAVHDAPKPSSQSRPASGRPPPPKLEDIGNGRGGPSISPLREASIRRDFMANVLRGSAVLFGMIASTMPSGVVLYWVTSMIYSLVQNVGMRAYAARQRAAKIRNETEAASKA